MLSVLNIDESIIIYIILNYQISKWVMRVVSCYTNTNWVIFEFVIFDLLIIRVVFGLANTIESLLLTRPTNTNYHPYLNPTPQSLFFFFTSIYTLYSVLTKTQT